MVLIVLNFCSCYLKIYTLFNLCLCSIIQYASMIIQEASNEFYWCMFSNASATRGRIDRQNRRRVTN